MSTFLTGIFISQLLQLGLRFDLSCLHLRYLAFQSCRPGKIKLKNIKNSQMRIWQALCMNDANIRRALTVIFANISRAFTVIMAIYYHFMILQNIMINISRAFTVIMTIWTCSCSSARAASSFSWRPPIMVPEIIDK